MRRALCLSLLLLAVVMVLVSGAVQAGQAEDAFARGKPWLSLRDTVALTGVYTGPEASTRALEQDVGQPLALAAADLDEDGVPDLVVGYAVPGDQQGAVALYRGNVGAIYPAASQSSSPFLEDVRLAGLAIPPDFLATGDFDGDGHLDLVAAARGGGDLVLLPGDGRGGLGPATPTPLPGPLSALVAGEIDRRDGLADLAAGVVGPEGPHLLVFEGPDGALRDAPAAIPLSTPAGATALALGHLDGDYLLDVAVAAGRELLIVHGRDRRLSMGPGQGGDETSTTVARHSFPLDISALAAGDFVGDYRTDLALLFADGSVQVLDRPAGGVHIGQLPLSTVPGTTGRLSLLAARVSSLPKDDLLVLDGAGRRLHVLRMGSDWAASGLAAAYPGPWPRSPDLEPLALDLGGEPLAVLPMRLNEDALSDLVILREGSAQPEVSLTAPGVTFTVNSTGDGGDSDLADKACKDGSGACTLRAAIEQASVLTSPRLIQFNIPGTGTHTIILTNSLVVTAPLTIDAMSQPGFAGTPLIELNATAVTYDALVVSGGSSVVRGLAINRAGVDGIHLDTVGNNTIEGNYLGTNISGTAVLSNAGQGIRIEAVPDNTIGGTAEQARNLISGNGVFGIHIVGTTATLNSVVGNYIGTTADGTSSLGNWEFAVLVESAADNTIGGAEAGAGNLVSGNGSHGVVLSQVGATGNLVQGNYVGTQADGIGPLGNLEYGLFLVDAPGNTVKNNVISDNWSDGVVIYGATATSNLLLGNYIGTDKNGTGPLANMAHGVLVDGAPGNTIGGTAAGDRNVISGNLDDGIEIVGSGATGNKVQGNYIGTDRNGSAALPNVDDGLFVNDAPNNIVGGGAEGAGNLISGNGSQGVQIFGGGATTNTIEGNYIGTDSSGTADLGNSSQGLLIANAPANTVCNNLISGNDNVGLEISGDIAAWNRVLGNRIGTDRDGANALGNTGDGVFVDGSSDNTIGGTAPGEGNTIAYNAGVGIGIRETARGNRISGNSIHHNGGLGIDLGVDGQTPNDPGDGDPGANKLQNWPEITRIEIKGAQVEATFKVDTGPASAQYPFQVEFFVADGGSVGAEGQTYLGAVSYLQAEAQTVVTRAFTPTDVAEVTDHLVATATDDEGNTSEFSWDVAEVPLFKTAEPQVVGLGEQLTYTIHVHNHTGAQQATGIVDPIPADTQYVPGSAWASQGAPTYTGNSVTWNGQLAAGAVLTVGFFVDVTQQASGTITNQAQVTLGGQVYTLTARTEVTFAEDVPLVLRSSTPTFLPTRVFTPGHTLLLYTVSGGQEPNCCTPDRDLYVVVNADTDNPLKMENGGAGQANRAKADFGGADCHHSLWYTPTATETYSFDLYVVEAGQNFTPIELAHNLVISPNRTPSLTVLTDLRELYNESNLTDSNSASSDRNHNCVGDYYEAVERVRQYAAAHGGVVVDVRQDAYTSDRVYTTSTVTRINMGQEIDKLVSCLPMTTGHHLAIIGDDAVVPFYRHPDPQPNDEKEYRAGKPHGVPTLIDTHANLIMTDVPYGTLSTRTPKYPQPNLALGRIFAARPLSLTAMIGAYEQPVVVGPQTGSAFVFNVPNDIKIDFKANTKACAVDVLRTRGYTIETTTLADLGKLRRRGWMDRQSGVLWTPLSVRLALNRAGGNRLTVINTHASHLSNSLPGTYFGVRDLNGLPPFPGAVFVNFGCHGGYSTGYDARPYNPAVWHYYYDALVLAIQERHLAYHANTTYGHSSGNASLFFNDQIHHDFLDQLLVGSRTTGEARRLAQSNYYVANPPASWVNTDTIAVYGTELYGLPTQPITRALTVLKRGAVRGPGLASAQATHVLTANLDVPDFRVTPDGGVYTLFEVPHGGELTAWGSGPLVPLLVRRFDLPAGATGLGVTLVSSTTSVYPQGVQLPPQQAGNRTFGVSTVPFTGTAPYPETLHWTDVYTDAGAIRLAIGAIPLRWDPVSGQATLYHALEFRVEYDPPATGVQVGDLILNDGNPVSSDMSDFPISMTVTSSDESPLTLLWLVEDPGGSPLRSGLAEFVPAVGANALGWSTDSLGWEPGPKVLRVTLEDGDGTVLATAQHEFVVEGRSLVISADRGVYGSPHPAALLRAEVRDQTGAQVAGLSGDLAQTLDGTPLALTWQEGESYTATLDLTTVSTGLHRLEVDISAAPLAGLVFGLDRDPPTSTVRLQAQDQASLTLSLESWDELSNVDLITVEYRVRSFPAGQWLGDWTTWITRSTAWDYENGAPADLEPVFGPSEPVAVDLAAYHYCFRSQALDAVGNQEGQHAGADLCVGPHGGLWPVYLPLVVRDHGG